MCVRRVLDFIFWCVVVLDGYCNDVNWVYCVVLFWEIVCMMWFLVYVSVFYVVLVVVVYVVSFMWGLWVGFDSLNCGGIQMVVVNGVVWFFLNGFFLFLRIVLCWSGIVGD